MKKILLVNLLALSLVGCATTQTQPMPFNWTNEVVDPAPVAIRAPTASDSFQLSDGNDPALEKAFNQYLKSGKPPNIITEGFVIFAYNAGQQPVVKATPFQETVISLERGERHTNVTSGDPDRWSYSVAVSGSGSHFRENILVKPSMPSISTNLVITTNRRLYNIRFVSVNDSEITRQVSFWYPEDMLNNVNHVLIKEHQQEPVSTVPKLAVDQINFNYRIQSHGFGAAPRWQPVRVFDDGVHTYIQFPANIASRDMPVLWVSSKANQQELVNYRSKPPYFVVDKIFKNAVLVVGVGKSQEKVSLININEG